MAEYDPYIPANAGEFITAKKWNDMQEDIRRSVNEHTHNGGGQVDDKKDSGCKIDGTAIDENSALAVKSVSVSEMIETAALKVNGELESETILVTASMTLQGELKTETVNVNGVSVSGDPETNSIKVNTVAAESLITTKNVISPSATIVSLTAESGIAEKSFFVGSKPPLTKSPRAIPEFYVDGNAMVKGTLEADAFACDTGVFDDSVIIGKSDLEVIKKDKVVIKKDSLINRSELKINPNVLKNTSKIDKRFIRKKPIVKPKLTVNGKTVVNAELEAESVTVKDKLTVGSINVTMTIIQEGWKSISYQNGWMNYGSSYNPGGYFKDKNGIVHLRGLMKKSDGRRTPVGLVFTLSAGYRPEYRELQSSIAQKSEDSRCRIDILPNGEVHVVEGGSSGWTSLDGITFRAK